MKEQRDYQSQKTYNNSQTILSTKNKISPKFLPIKNENLEKLKNMQPNRNNFNANIINENNLNGHLKINLINNNNINHTEKLLKINNNNIYHFNENITNKKPRYHSNSISNNYNKPDKIQNSPSNYNKPDKIQNSTSNYNINGNDLFKHNSGI